MVSAAQSTLTKETPAREPRIETTGGVADTLRPVIDASFGASIPLDFEFWDGSKLTAAESSATMRFNSPDAIRRVLWMPNELGLSRAYVAGDLDVEGDLYGVITLFRDSKPAVLQPRTA